MADAVLGQGGPRGKFQYQGDPVSPSDFLGLARDFSPTNFPVNGLRHPRTKQTCGWYIWSSEDQPTADDAFQPVHVAHLLESCPDVAAYLELPAGWRFLIAPDYEDVWKDDSLFDV